MKIESNDNNPIFIPKNSINLNLDENLNPKSTKVKVVARFRPINSVEDVKYNDYIQLIGRDNICIKYNNITTVDVNDNSGYSKNSFTLDRVFDPQITQELFYDEVIQETIADVLKGVNGTVFAYGQSGSGKTFTMYGNDLFDDSKGVIPRSM